MLRTSGHVPHLPIAVKSRFGGWPRPRCVRPPDLVILAERSTARQWPARTSDGRIGPRFRWVCRRLALPMDTPMQPGMEVQGSTGSLLSLHMLNPMRRFYTSAGAPAGAEKLGTKSRKCSVAWQSDWDRGRLLAPAPRARTEDGRMTSLDRQKFRARNFCQGDMSAWDALAEVALRARSNGDVSTRTASAATRPRANSTAGRRGRSARGSSPCVISTICPPRSHRTSIRPSSCPVGRQGGAFCRAPGRPTRAADDPAGRRSAAEADTETV